MKFLLILSCLFLYGESRPASSPNLYDPNPLILGGRDATVDQFPWQMTVEYYSRSGGYFIHMCGAVLYKSKYALSAAHCFDGLTVADITLWAGVLNRSDKESTLGRRRDAMSILKHPNYQAIAGFPNDLAILTLTSEIDLPPVQSNIENAVLPPDDTNDFLGGRCQVSGWGRTSTDNAFPDILQYEDIPLITITECSSRLANVGNALVSDSNICTLTDPPVTALCNGDSGTPLTCFASASDPETATRYVAGLGSFGQMTGGNCNPVYPSVYVRLSKYIDWIEANTP